MAKEKSQKVESALTTMDNKWRAENDLNTLMQACEIKKDKKRMDAVRVLAKDRLAELAKVSVDVDDDAANEPDGNDD